MSDELDAFETWRQWFRKQQGAGNTRSLAEIMRDRHGDDCDCDECVSAKQQEVNDGST